MGVGRFFLYLKEKHPDVIKPLSKRIVPYSSAYASLTPALHHRRPYVDATLFLTKFAFRSATSLEIAIEHFSVLSTTLQKMSGLKPVFVVDGERSEDKARYTTHQRAATKKRLADLPGYDKIFFHGWKDQLAKGFLTRDMELIVSPDGFEAEEVCARLAASDRDTPGVVVTEDSDALIFGAPAILTGVWTKNQPAIIELTDVLSALQLTKDQLIDVGLLVGCDFASKLPGVGMTRAVAGIKAYGSIEGYLKYREKMDAKWALYQFFASSFDFVRGRQNFNRSLDIEGLVSTGFDRKIHTAGLLLTGNQQISRLAGHMGKKVTTVKARMQQLTPTVGSYRSHFFTKVSEHLQRRAILTAGWTDLPKRKQKLLKERVNNV